MNLFRVSESAQAFVLASLILKPRKPITEGLGTGAGTRFHLKMLEIREESRSID